MPEPMTTYRFGVMSDVREMEADCDTVAHAAALMSYRSDAPIVFYAPEQENRVLHFGQLNGGDVEANLNAHFGGDFGAFLEANSAQITHALNSIREA